jgi:ATP-dependent DNA ligase
LPKLCERMLYGKRRIDVMLIVFDLLAAEGRDVTRRPYWERRQLLEGLDLDGDGWATTPAYQDGEALWEKVCELGLEGVAKKRSGTTCRARRGWIKTKNRQYWRYPLEVEAARQLGRQPAH